MSRSEYISVLRKDQPLSELERKAIKSTRFKGKIWTQEQIDLIVAQNFQLLSNLSFNDLDIAND